MKTLLWEQEGLRWLDLVAPTSESLRELAQELRMPASVLEDCLDPEHLPKFELLEEDCKFYIFRSFDSAAAPHADTVQKLTRKTAVFYQSGTILTIHRTEQPYLKDVLTRLQEQSRRRWSSNEILSLITVGAMRTYLKPLEQWYADLEKMEHSAFELQMSSTFLRRAYYLRRKVSVVKRLSRMTQELLNEIKDRDTRDVVRRVYFLSDEIYDHLNQLLALYLSMASQKTNEVMRVLTLFSAFFLPLSFLAALWGMNFKFMPELNWAWGYPAALGLMTAFALLLFFWFKKKRWMA